MTAVAALWLGPVHQEAKAAYARAREAGLTSLRALVVGSVASFKDCWAFRRKLAAHVGCSVRTVQRAITQARAEGLIGVARAKPGEKPPGYDGTVDCGFSHRWTVGWGAAGRLVKERIAAAKARWLIRVAMGGNGKKSEAPAQPKTAGESPPRPSSGNKSTEAQRRTWTAAELDAELERLESTRRPPD